MLEETKATEKWRSVHLAPPMCVGGEEDETRLEKPKDTIMKASLPPLTDFMLGNFQTLGRGYKEFNLA